MYWNSILWLQYFDWSSLKKCFQFFFGSASTSLKYNKSHNKTCKNAFDMECETVNNTTQSAVCIINSRAGWICARCGFYLQKYGWVNVLNDIPTWCASCMPFFVYYSLPYILLKYLTYLFILHFYIST